MTERAKKVSSGVLLTMGTSINFATVIGLAYSMGQKSEKLEAVESRTAAVEVMVMKTRENLDDKMDRMLQAVSRLEGKVERRK